MYKMNINIKNNGFAKHEAQELLQELCRYYHTIDKEKGKNHWTFPPVKDGKVLK